jgi:hypothetical protein
MNHTPADGLSEFFGGLTRVLFWVSFVLLIIDVRPWVWLALIAIAATFATEVALITRQRSFGGALGTVGSSPPAGRTPRPHPRPRWERRRLTELVVRPNSGSRSIPGIRPRRPRAGRPEQPAARVAGRLAKHEPPAQTTYGW